MVPQHILQNVNKLKNKKVESITGGQCDPMTTFVHFKVIMKETNHVEVSVSTAIPVVMLLV